MFNNSRRNLLKAIGAVGAISTAALVTPARCDYCGLYSPLGNCKGCGAPNEPVNSIQENDTGTFPVKIECYNQEKLLYTSVINCWLLHQENFMAIKPVKARLLLDESCPREVTLTHIQVSWDRKINPYPLLKLLPVNKAIISISFHHKKIQNGSTLSLEWSPVGIITMGNA